MKFAGDTSVLVPCFLEWHECHDPCRSKSSLINATISHTVFEAYAVMTRLPAGKNIRPKDAAELLKTLPQPIFQLDSQRSRELVNMFAAGSVYGGAAYDGLIAATAIHYDLTLLTRDQRAVKTYRSLGANYELV